MKRIGKPVTGFIFLILLSGLLPSISFAQSDVNVNATVSETTIYIGERISLTIEVSGNFNNASRPELPEFKGFRLLSNSPSFSRRFEYVNGQTTTTFAYSYYLIAQDHGNYRIPEATVNIDGEEYKTEPISVRIIDRDEASTDPSSGSHPDIFLQLDTSDKHPIPGQQMITDVNLFFKDGLEVNSYQPVPGWKAEGFWKEELENTERPRAESVIVQGQRFRKARLLQFALFPTKMGTLTISPYEIIVTVRSASQNDPMSSFFGGFGSNQRKMELRSEPVTINVEPLPTIDEATYLGAVGSFNISRTVNKQEAIVGESIEIKTTLRGTGNIPLISKPTYDLPEGLEIYDPEETSSVNRRNKKISGVKTFTDVVIARNAGTYTIPEKKVAYFNDAQNRYIRETLPSITFTAKRDPNTRFADGQSTSLNIRPVTGLATWATPSSSDLISRWWFWAGLLIPLVILAVGYWRKSYLDKLNSDTAFARARQADEIAHERLQKAITMSEEGNVREAYNILQKTLTGFIGDRLNLPEAGLSIQQYVSELGKREIDENLVKNIRMLLDKCASVSYAPDISHAYLKSHVGLAQSILDKLKKEL